MNSTPSSASRRLPGDPGVWIFIIADMMVFGLLFTSFIIERGKNVALFNLSRQALDFNYGGVNTLILLTSSWFVVLAVRAAKADRLKQVPHFLAAGAFCGAAFGVLKVTEYAHKLSAGISMLTNDFYMYYFILTGIHLLHVIGGTVVLLVLWGRSKTGVYNSSYRVGLESGASFWHMVDLLWIILFPLLYLMR
jgi:nitric oxide reductase NorE protein